MRAELLPNARVPSGNYREDSFLAIVSVWRQIIVRGRDGKIDKAHPESFPAPSVNQLLQQPCLWNTDAGFLGDCELSV